MEYEVFGDRVIVHAWRVEAIGPDGEGYVAIFSGPEAEERAREYAQHRVALERGGQG